MNVEHGRAVGRLLIFCMFTIAGALDQRKNALIIIDVQNCFLDGGTNPVANGNQVISVINSIREKFEEQFPLVVLSQDWHCPDHVSFASRHMGKQPFTQIVLQYDAEGHLCSGSNVDSVHAINCSSVAHNVNQTLWPDHCVMHTNDAEFSDRLNQRTNDVIVRKGYACQVDSYSAFYDNGGFSQTQLDSILKENGITDVYITGLALDFCVYFTSMDAQKLRYTTYTILDATRGISEEGIMEAKREMKASGVHLIMSTDLDGLLRTNGKSPLMSCSWLVASLILCSFGVSPF